MVTAEEFVKASSPGEVGMLADLKKIHMDKHVYEFMRRFAKMHVTEALKAAAEKCKMEVVPYDIEPWEIIPEVIKQEDLADHEEGFEISINKATILEAYPDTNIQ